MSAPKIHKLEVSSHEIYALAELARRIGPVLKMLEPDAKTEISAGLLTLLCVMERANKG